MAETHKESCFCGAIEIEATGEPSEMGYCHCGSCRHCSGAPLVAFILFAADQVKVARGGELLSRFQ